MTTTNIPVLILKSPDTSISPDPYLQQFSIFTQYHAQLIPVLDQEFVQIEQLCHTLSEKVDVYGGMILTSKRAVEAMKQAMDILGEEHIAPWTTKAIYTVGNGTATSLTTLLHPEFKPMGSESGTADRLSDYIAKTYPHEPSARIMPVSSNANESSLLKPLLFLNGDKRRDVLPTKLNESGMPFEELMVYKTIPTTKFLEEATLRISQSTIKTHIWILFFSPSGVQASIDILKQQPWWNTQCRIAAIGPTTEEALKQIGVPVHVTAKNPCAEDMIPAIVEYDKST